MSGQTPPPGGDPNQPPQGQPPQQGGHPPQGQPPQQGGYPPQGQPPQQGGHPPQGQPPQQGGYPPQGQPPQQGGYPPQQGGYGGPPQGGYGAPPPADGPNRRPYLIGAAIALVIALAAALVIPQLGGDDGDDTIAGPGEVFLQPASSPGPDPFSLEDALAAAPDPSLASPTTDAVPPAASGSIQSTSGGQPGLYGGSNDNAACNPELMKSFLESSPEKAAAWVAALNADPDLRWAPTTPGTFEPLQVADLGDYIDSLTTLVLRSDTRVTNHGFRDGQARPLQSVLQAGTAVLVDAFGVPRARCKCGNPLIPPKATEGTTYVGTSWEGFEPSRITVTSPNPTPLTEIIVTDPNGNQVRISTVPPGCVGAADPFRCAIDVRNGNPPPATATPTPVPTATATPTQTVTPPPTPTATPTPTPTPTPTAAPSPTATPTGPPTPTEARVSVPCSDATTREQALLVIDNQTPGPIDVYWYDFNCDEQYFFTLAPGEAFPQETTVGHSWVARLPDGTFVDAHQTASSQDAFVIQ